MSNCCARVIRGSMNLRQATSLLNQSCQEWLNKLLRITVLSFLVAGTTLVPPAIAQDTTACLAPAEETTGNGNGNGAGNGNNNGNSDGTGNGNNNNNNDNNNNSNGTDEPTNCEPTVETSGFGGGFGGPPPVTPLVLVEHLERQGVDERLSSDGFDLLGDQIDNNTGSLVFSQTDIVIPGNSHLSVALTRRREQGLKFYPNTDVDFGDWQLDVPKISVIVGMNTFNGSATEPANWAANRCVYPDPPPKSLRIGGGSVPPPPGGGSWSFDNIILGADYSNGVRMEIPGQGSMLLLKKSLQGSQWTVDTIDVSTSNWIVECLDDGASDGGDGFKARAPNGDVYYFDRLVYRPATWIPVGPSYLARAHAFLLATRVEDVHGNTVDYSYDASNDNRLDSIQGNDGRRIDLTYTGSSKIIETAVANGRTWDYVYTSLPGGNVLSEVKLPSEAGQLRKWEFTMGNMDYKPSAGVSCSTPNAVVTVKHPNGITGTFTLQETKHGRTQVSSNWGTTIGYCGSENPTLKHAYFEAMSIVEKKLESTTSPASTAIPTSIWNYSYLQDTGNFSGSTGSLPDTRWTQIIDPLGHKTIYHHNRRANSNLEGLLIQQEIFDTLASSTPVQTVDFTYVVEEEIGSTYLSWYENAGKMTRPRHGDVTTTTRGADVYTVNLDYDNSHASSSYSYGAPTKVTRSNNYTTNQRIVDTTYITDKTKWILALPNTITRNSKLFSTLTYNNNGKITHHYAFAVGSLQQKAGYNPDGTVLWVEDGLLLPLTPRRTTFTNYKRGLPQTITRADASTLSRTVNDDGRVTTETDGNGNLTTYDYFTTTGWLEKINRPAGWSPTDFTYTSTANGIVQTAQRGSTKVTTEYDGYTRPVLVKTEATSNGGVTSYVKSEFDANGRGIFTSFPSTTSTSTAGTNFTFDTLGRITGSNETVTPFVSTTTNYLSSNKTEFIDAENGKTIRHYHAYGSPDSGELYRIEQIENASETTDTYIDRNDYGQPLTVRQTGNYNDIKVNGINVDESQFYVYDSQQRVCRHYTPEGGYTGYDYTDANEVKYVAKGLSGSACSSITNETSLVTLEYDDLGRLWKTDFADTATPDIIRTFDDNSNVLTVNRDAAVQADDVLWSYTYGTVNNIKTEALSIDAKTYSLGYDYNTDGQLIERTLPGGFVIDMPVNGLGQPTEITNGTTKYAKNIGYYVNGSVESATFGNGSGGNGHMRSTTWNARQLPKSITVANGAVKSLDSAYLYNGRGQIVDVDDFADTGSPNNDRLYGYDNQGRLENADGPWGHVAYVIDSLANLRSKTFTNISPTRTVTVSYDSNNRASQSTDTQGATRSIGYTDGRGNVNTLGGMTFSYDLSDQPTSISGTAAVDYRYDGNLKRVIQDVTGGDTIYSIYDASGTLVHRDNVTVSETTHYVSAVGATIRVKNGTPTYVFNDHLGSTTTGTDASGAILWRERYTPFGDDYPTNTTNEDEPGFTGHVMDEHSGLTYMQARYYDPVIGRFLSIDPVGFTPDQPFMFNRFAYANHDPINTTDPSGMAGKVASGVRLVADGIKRAGRLTKEQAVRIRRQGGEIHSDTRQVQMQIERAANTGNRTIRRDKGHDLKNPGGTTRTNKNGDPVTGANHVQTEGVAGHNFNGKNGVVNALVEGAAVVMEAVGEALETVGEGAGFIEENFPRTMQLLDPIGTILEEGLTEANDGTA